MITINLNADLKRVTKSLDNFAEKQIPFAMATALNAIGRRVKLAEDKSIEKEFPSETPFTRSGVGQKKARKADLETEIYLRDITASYLAPYIDGGKHKLNSSALLNPKNIPVNQYGNLPRNKLAALKARADVFIGPVQTKAGTINGVWQRMPAVKARKATKTRQAKVAKAAHLKLLIRFGDALEVKQHLPWTATAQKIVAQSFDKEFGSAMGKAIATARLK